MIANLGAFKNEYATSTDAARKAEIRKQYKEGIEKAKAMEGKLVAAAVTPMPKPPSRSENVVKVLVGTLYEFVWKRITRTLSSVGKTLMDNKCTEKLRARAGGRGGLLCERVRPGRDLVERRQGLRHVVQDQQRNAPDGTPRDYSHYPETIDASKPVGPRRRRFAKPKPRPTICRACS